MAIERLWDRVAACPPQHPLWLSQSLAATAEATTAEGLEAFRKEHASVLRGLSGRRVVLDLNSADQYARALTLLDGVAEAMLLLPNDLGAADQQRLIDAFAPSAVVTERGSGSLDVDLVVSAAASTWAMRERPASEATQEAQPTMVPTEWVLATSGTTAVPKLVGHTLASLSRSTRAGSTGASGDGKKVTKRWGLLYSIERFAGLQVFLQSLWSQETLLLPTLDAPLEERLAFLDGQGCTALSATPSLFRQLLLSATGRRLPLAQITLGGEIAEQPVLNGLAATFPGARIVHIYASTEAGVGFSVSDGLAGFPVAYLDTRENDALTRRPRLRVADGRLFLAPSQIDQRFLSDTETPLADRDGWIDSGDLVAVGEDRVVFLGRVAGAINVGGSKVLPEEVEAVILAMPGVADCVVRGRRSGWTGSIVEAYVVPSEELNEPESHKSFTRAVRKHCAATLAKFKIPAIVRVVSSVELAPAGKKQRSITPKGGLSPKGSEEDQE